MSHKTRRKGKSWGYILVKNVIWQFYGLIVGTHSNKSDLIIGNVVMETLATLLYYQINLLFSSYFAK